MRKNSGFSLFFGKEFLTNYLHRYVSTATPISTLASMKRFQLRWDSCRISSSPHAATLHYARINGQVPILIIFVDVFFGRVIAVNGRKILRLYPYPIFLNGVSTDYRSITVGEGEALSDG
jgi:hypothetical protein